MKTWLICLALAASACANAPAFAQMPNAPARPQILLNDATSETGRLIKKELQWSSAIPLNKTYEELSPEQKAEFHSVYESLPPGDEPPFALEGLKPVFSAIKKGQAALQARGNLNMAVTVGADGKATQVTDYGSVDDPEMIKFASTVLLMTKFKPAVCAGKPCIMQFPFTLQLKRG